MKLCHDAGMTMPQPVPAGWYPATNRPGYEIWWDGYQWTDTTRPVPPPPVAQYPGPPPIMHGKIVTKVPKQTSHTFHLIMSLLTCGLWAVFVWLPITIYNSMTRDKHVTRY